MMLDTVGPDGKGLYRAGGISAIVFGIAYIVIIALYVPMGARPGGAEAWLASGAGHTTAWWVILGLSVLTDFLLVPIALSLYRALQGINRNVMLTATACVGLFVVLDLAFTWTNIASLITLGGHYAAATNRNVSPYFCSNRRQIYRFDSNRRQIYLRSGPFLADLRLQMT